MHRRANLFPHSLGRYPPINDLDQPAAIAAHLPVANASRLQTTTPTRALDEDSLGLQAKSK